MPANLDKPDRWKADIARSVDLYNQWFMQFAPVAFRQARAETSGSVAKALAATSFLCGYFDSGFLGYEAAEGIDWVWEHRPGDLAELGL